ncbi:Golgin subfamily A member 7/ERF4 family-domain-containing protein [Gamsiella multidivaricata]|uniref:Golgin subfamily A member 7/ERF4 family-domain-containing protein n=1 Tax=Gamsiella multidivaricata TaxID=101098 RepID=UPI00221EE783|nr:Golgin subfamily A member 7/ERF4 family-domain-containing protein [Gamsiella multidivaricata]KAI7832745.1 Golgin subfamily A member 7/ERF4 family-domain-containing protein [Gamsiella multidivaricata]
MWQLPSEPPPEDAVSVPIPLPTLTSATFASDSNHAVVVGDDNVKEVVPGHAPSDASTIVSPHPHSKPLPKLPSQFSPSTAPKYPSTSTAASAALGPNGSTISNRGTRSSVNAYSSEQPTGTARLVVRIERDHHLGDEATRFETEQFPEEFLGRITRQELKATVEGINECMRDAEESIMNCLDTFLDCLTAYTAKYCFGTHYQRAIRKMEQFIEQENRRLYHPARMHLRDPQKVGMIYLEFEIF